MQVVDELAAILAAAYESFLRVRLERRTERRGKVHRRALLIAIDMVAEMITEVGIHEREALWRGVISGLDHDRAEIEADVLEHHGCIEVEHEWAAFLVLVGQVRGASW